VPSQSEPTSDQKEPCDAGLGRRELLTLAGTAAALTACGGGTTGPANTDLGAGADIGGGGPDLSGPCLGTPADGAETLAVGQAMSFPNTTTKTLSFFVARDARGFYALRNVCTHLGCNTAFNAATKAFECPCHSSAFHLDGTVKNGPAALPLRAFPICRDADNKLLVDTSSPSDDLSARLPP
jgi:nitrite reductase/ring-hydroxylating ferredoxin subunit